MLTRRAFFTGLLAAPAIVQCSSLMHLRGVVLPVYPDYPELLRITEAAFVPRLYVQLYHDWCGLNPQSVLGGAIGIARTPAPWWDTGATS